MEGTDSWSVKAPVRFSNEARILEFFVLHAMPSKTKCRFPMCGDVQQQRKEPRRKLGKSTSNGPHPETTFLGKMFSSERLGRESGGKKEVAKICPGPHSQGKAHQHACQVIKTWEEIRNHSPGSGLNGWDIISPLIENICGQAAGGSGIPNGLTQMERGEKLGPEEPM